MRLFGIEISQGKEIDQIREDLTLMQRQLEDIGWVKLNGGNAGDSYTMLKESFDRMVSRCRLAFIRNPIVAQAINLTTWYTFGDGVGAPKAQDDEVQQIITDFWKHPDNKLSLTNETVQLKLSNKLQYDGELAIVLQTDMDGSVYIRILDPLTIGTIVQDPSDNMRPLFYKRRVQSRVQYIPDWQNGIAYLRDDSRYTDLWKKQLADLDIEEADVLKNTYLYHFKSNNDILDTRGIPDVYRALDWMNANSKINSDCASFINSQAQFAWDKKIEGTQNQVTAMKTRQSQNASLQNPAFMAGSTYAHNAKVDMKAVGLPGSSSGVFETGIRRTLLMMCAAFGIMEHYFGDPSTGNLATSKSMELPMLKKFLARRKMFHGIYVDLLNYQLDMKLLAVNIKAFTYVEMKNRLMVLPARDYKDRTIDIHFPPILEKDIKDMAEALDKAKTGALIPIETARRLFMQSVGIQDIEEELKKEFEKEPEPVDPLSAGKPIVESVRAQGRSVQVAREKSLKLAEKNKAVLAKLSGYKGMISTAYTQLVKQLKESLVAYRLPGGTIEGVLGKSYIQKRIKEFEGKMLLACHRFYPEVVDISERYVRAKIGGKIKEAHGPAGIALLEKKLDTFTDDQIKWNSDFVKKSLTPALQEAFDAINNQSFESEEAVVAAFDAIATAKEAQVGKYVGGLWTVAERAVLEGAKGSGAQANFIGVEDENTCEGCGDALDGNPYPVDECPTPGELNCQSNCRHAVQLIEDEADQTDTLSESDIQLLRDAESESRTGFKLLQEN